jgi:ribosomal protein S18 acetylase RimI-like enzyme
MGMGVISSHRRKGIGEKLLQKTIDDAHSKGIERIELEVFSSNSAAIALYKKLGFSIEGTKMNARRIDDVNYNFTIMALQKK